MIMMFKYDYKYAILLDKLSHGEDFIFLNFHILYSGGGVDHPFHWAFSRLITTYTCFYIALLLYASAYM